MKQLLGIVAWIVKVYDTTNWSAIIFNPEYVNQAMDPES